MKKNLLIAAIAITALASCSSNDYVGDTGPQGSNDTNGAISFNLNTASVTRAGGATAATALDNQFIVWGEKNESGGAAVAVPSANSVFPNYQVNWVEHALSTTSNSSGWEYVGYTHSNTANSDDYKTNISPSLGEAQTIKYWDMNASNYVFTAVSALKDDIKTGKIKITKTNTEVTNEYLKGYQIVATADADFTHLYFADRNKMTTGYGTTPVTMNFRNILSHIRVGIYETIPGYDVTAIKFYNTDYTDANEFKTTGSIFGATVDNLKPGANTLTVTYNSTTNQPIVSTSGDCATTITLGQNFNTLSTSSTMATSSATPTWETATGTYTSVFPREGITTDLTLKVKYTLYNSYSGETMDITGTATVPGEYLQWKPNYKYSYIFKLTDDALTPITFDAVQVETETGSIEYITTVDNPSITTYQNGSDVTNKSEYLSGSPIYVVVADGTALTVNTTAKLYTATVDEGYLEGITESTVANAIKNGADVSGSKVLTDANSKKLTVTPTSDGTLTAFTAIPAADSPTGADLTINGATFTPAAPTFTAQTPAGTENPSTEKWYERSGSEAPYVYVLTTDTTVDAQKTYYNKTASSAGYYVFEYIDGESKEHYKVIKVVDMY